MRGFRTKATIVLSVARSDVIAAQDGAASRNLHFYATVSFYILQDFIVNALSHPQ
jgi:hypothetical protein